MFDAAYACTSLFYLNDKKSSYFVRIVEIGRQEWKKVGIGNMGNWQIGNEIIFF